MPATSAPAPQKKNAPVKTFRFGLIKAAVWANPADNNQTFYSVKFTRAFQSGEQRTWGESDSFGRDDLPLVEKLAAKCHEWIFETMAQAKDSKPTV